MQELKDSIPGLPPGTYWLQTKFKAKAVLVTTNTPQFWVPDSGLWLKVSTDCPTIWKHLILISKQPLASPWICFFNQSPKKSPYLFPTRFWRLLHMLLLSNHTLDHEHEVIIPSPDCNCRTLSVQDSAGCVTTSFLPDSHKFRRFNSKATSLGWINRSWSSTSQQSWNIYLQGWKAWSAFRTKHKSCFDTYFPFSDTFQSVTAVVA